MNKPRIGLLLLSAEWIDQIGANKGIYKELPARIAGDGQNVVKILSGELQIINSGVVNAPAEAARAAALFWKEKVELILACYLTWGEDYLFLEVIKKLPEVPILFWCYTPYARLPKKLDMPGLFPLSGPVAVLQASGPLKRLGRSFGFAFGSIENKATLNYIFDYCRAAQVASSLKSARIGLLPSFCPQMSGTHVDEKRLKEEVGPRVERIPVSEYGNLINRIPGKRADGFVLKLKNEYQIDNVSDAALLKAARASLALSEVVVKYNLDALAFQDVDEELHRVIGLRPCLFVPELFEKAPVSMEGDVGAALAMLILKRLTGKPVMYTEIFAVDEKENAVLAGHAGMMDCRVSAGRKEVRIVPDYEYCEVEKETAAMLFRGKKGRVTLLSIFCDVAKFKMLVASGEALPGKPMLEGSSHIYVKLTTPLKDFFNKAAWTGTTQHWIVVHDNVADKLVLLAEILKMDCVFL